MLVLTAEGGNCELRNAGSLTKLKLKRQILPQSLQKESYPHQHFDFSPGRLMIKI